MLLSPTALLNCSNDSIAISEAEPSYIPFGFEAFLMRHDLVTASAIPQFSLFVRTFLIYRFKGRNKFHSICPWVRRTIHAPTMRKTVPVQFKISNRIGSSSILIFKNLTLRQLATRGSNITWQIKHNYIQ